MSNPANEGASMLEHGAEMLRQLPADALGTSREMVGAALEGVTQLSESTSEHLGDLTTAVVKAISRNPVRAVCVAVSLGCVLGIILFVRR
jgi:hypothetical protein